MGLCHFREILGIELCQNWASSRPPCLVHGSSFRKLRGRNSSFLMLPQALGLVPRSLYRNPARFRFHLLGHYIRRLALSMGHLCKICGVRTRLLGAHLKLHTVFICYLHGIWGGWISSSWSILKEPPVVVLVMDHVQEFCAVLICVPFAYLRHLALSIDHVREPKAVLGFIS